MIMLLFRGVLGITWLISVIGLRCEAGVPAGCARSLDGGRRETGALAGAVPHEAAVTVDEGGKVVAAGGGQV